MSTLEAALALAKTYPVFPCSVAKKRPACENGFLDASKDDRRVLELWRDAPNSLIGIPTGYASGLDALDVDPRHNGEVWLEEARDSLPITRIHHTRGGGIHMLFRHHPSVRNSQGKIARGVDVRGEGGYLIWWPAHDCAVVHPDAIEDWPKWLLKILNPPPKPRPPAPATKIEADARAAVMVERAFARVRNAAPGQRHYQLRAAAATLGGLRGHYSMSQAQIEHELVELAMAAGGEDRSNAEKTAKWAMDKGSASPLLSR